jgi:hypothetical protein
MEHLILNITINLCSSVLYWMCRMYLTAQLPLLSLQHVFCVFDFFAFWVNIVSFDFVVWSRRKHRDPSTTNCLKINSFVQVMVQMWMWHSMSVRSWTWWPIMELQHSPWTNLDDARLMSSTLRFGGIFTYSPPASHPRRTGQNIHKSGHIPWNVSFSAYFDCSV